MIPFFSIITRTFAGREQLLERCRASVSEQTFADVEHIIVRDEQRAGVAAAQLLMHHVKPRGQFVFVLDDDDFLSNYDVLERLRDALITAGKPPFAIVRVNHGILGDMPLCAWGERPHEGQITVSNAVVRHEIWYATRTAFTAQYAGDFSWIDKLFEDWAPSWLDLVVVDVETMRNGATA